MSIHKIKNGNIQVYESPVRRIIADSEKSTFKSIQSYNEAKKTPNAVVIFEGDYGGQIYLTCPMAKVKCNEKTLKRLIADIDALCWDYLDSTGLFYEIHENNGGIAGGMGGGIVKTKAWIHPELIKLKLDSAIIQVLNGKLKTIKDKN